MLPLGGTTETKTRILLEEVQRQDLSSKEWLFAYEQARKLQQEVAMLRGHRAAQAELLDLFEHLWTYVDIPFDILFTSMRFNDAPYVFLLSKNPMSPIWLESNEDFQKKVYFWSCLQVENSIPQILLQLSQESSKKDLVKRLVGFFSKSPWYEIQDRPTTEAGWSYALPTGMFGGNIEQNKLAIQSWIADFVTSLEFFEPNQVQRCLLMHRFIREFCLHFGAPVPITPLSFLEEVNDETL
jgi:hypothetical protein